jgi:hypothetical protein
MTPNLRRADQHEQRDCECYRRDVAKEVAGADATKGATCSERGLRVENFLATTEPTGMPVP